MPNRKMLYLNFTKNSVLISVILLLQNLMNVDLNAQSIYEKCWNSDSLDLKIKVHQKGFSYISVGPYDSLGHSKFKLKGNQLVFIDKYWNGFYNASEKQYFRIDKLSEDTLIISAEDTAHRHLYSIYGFEFQENIVFINNRQKCILNKGEAVKP